MTGRGPISWADRRVVLAAWGMCAVTVAVATCRLVLAVADPDSAGAVERSVPGGGVPLALAELLLLASFAVIGAFVAARRPANPLGWFLCATPLLLGIGLLGERWYWHVVLDDPGGSALADLGLWVSNWSWIPAVAPMFTFVPLLFPSGHPPGRRWRPLGWAAGIAIVALVLALAFAPGEYDEYPGVENPVGVSGINRDVLGAIGFPLLIVATLGSLASLVVRFRRARGVERQQLKWVTAAAALLVAIWLSMTLLDAQVDDDVAWVMFIGGLLVVAGAVALAILRYRLYDIDLVINRALVYSGLTATLAGAYLGSVLLLQLVLSSLTSDSGLAVAGSTLAVAALFRPARSRIQEAVDHRFYRRRYDARHTVESFSARLRDQVDLAALSSDLNGVVRDTLQPAHVSLWIRERP